MSIDHERELSPLSAPCRTRAEFPPVRKEFDENPQHQPNLIERLSAPVFKKIVTYFREMTGRSQAVDFMPESAKSASTGAFETQYFGK
ncbi:hypothetical protein [Roseobacter sp. N2S]|uniref:hypothetical protein n=1 Tax=Roseobacter sp. N2S TaxID=2663844 RepID=UPI002860E302|nr:hypothetical protein [Roseobacter sp. N2S]MDR6265185.1 hypothetical protein [Roseobacter sp. N2S]